MGPLIFVLCIRLILIHKLKQTNQIPKHRGRPLLVKYYTDVNVIATFVTFIIFKGS